MTNLTDKYITKLTTTLNGVNKSSITDVADVLREAIQNGRTIFVFGNGGSASTSSHLAQDLSKMLGAKAISLTDSVPNLLAYGNDTGFDNVFRGQLEKLAQPLDVVVGISGSGNSQNVLTALDLAKTFRCVTVGLSGYSGGKLKDIVDYNVHVHCDDMQICEDCHLIISHLLIKLLQ